MRFRQALFAIACACSPGLLAEPAVVGWIERVSIVGAATGVLAKLDTGAEHSSLHAQDLVLEERNGVTWARFVLSGEHGERTVIERPVVRRAHIKRHAGEVQQRPVIRLTLCMADQRREVEVNLVDRARFDYPLLIGRSFLHSRFLIDSARTRLSEPRCSDG